MLRNPVSWSEGNESLDVELHNVQEEFFFSGLNEKELRIGTVFFLFVSNSVQIRARVFLALFLANKRASMHPS